MLTGDKIETAINIGFSCKLLSASYQIIKVEQINKQALMK
jgi:magnesium-transporting ATPase (P-type)